MIESKVSKVIKYLKAYSDGFAPILGEPLNDTNTCKLDLSKNNELLRQINIKKVNDFSKFIFRGIRDSRATYGYGGYRENREHVYGQHQHFSTEEVRSIHLGVDIWAPANTTIYSPLESKVHSFKNNKGQGDYGPTIILEHPFENLSFYMLFGHLTEASLEGLKPGMLVKKGQPFAKIGDVKINGGWPPHLHFQIICDIGGYSGDYPGVAAPSQQEQFFENCPDPDLLLR